MKTILITIFASLMILVVTNSCKEKEQNNDYQQAENHFKELNDNLNHQFSEKACYNSIMLINDKLMGNTILVKVSQNQDSVKPQEWFYMNGKWDKKAEINADSAKIKNTGSYFNLTSDFDIFKLADIVQQAKEKVIEEKKVKNVEWKGISLLMKENIENADKMMNLIIQVTILDKNEGEDYELSFDYNGKFKGFLD
ncbi:MAG: hypothetical protein U0W24_18075 [Bacteroidales bacterium]